MDRVNREERDHQQNIHYSDDLGTITSNIGIEIELSPEVAELLRGRHEGESNSDQDVAQDHRKNHLVDPEDNWAELMAPPSGFLNQEDNVEDRDEHVTSETLPDSNSRHHQVNQQYDTDDQLSHSPPPSLPVLLVDFERLLGYQPTSRDEALLLRDQIRAALLWGRQPNNHENGESRYGINNNQNEKADCGDDDNGNIPGIDFEERVAEFCSAQIARQSDTLQVQQNHDDNTLQFGVIDYPEYLLDTLHDNSYSSLSPSPRVLPTARVWKRLIQPHSTHVVNELLQHLLTCNRPLLWKYKMHAEILALARAEDEAQIQRERARALQEWRLHRRKEQLDQLYEVRETFLHRLEVAEENWNKLEEDRNVCVAQLLSQKHLETGRGMGLQGFDFASNVFAFAGADNYLMGLHEPPEEEDDEYNLMGDYDEDYSHFGDDVDDEQDDDYDDNNDENPQDREPSLDEEASNAEIDEETPDAENVSSVNTLEPSFENPDPDLRRKRQLDARKRRRQRLELAAKEAENEARLQTAKQEEEEMRQACITPEWNVAKAIVENMKAKLQKIDHLLETLQEEEWEDEEEGVTNTVEGSQSRVRASVGLSLLDQILAMILGAKVNIDNKNEAEFVRELQEAHLAITSAWQQRFGRLPPGIATPQSPTAGMKQMASSSSNDHTPVSPTQNPSSRNIALNEVSVTKESLLEAYGIQEQNIDDWEDAVEEDDEEAAHKLHQTKEKQTTLVGLRPGGKLR